MTETRYPASFMRGGTSKALMFRRDDLPADRSAWAAIFAGAMGSPDPYGRQLNGMGGGVSSLSKVCVVGPSEHPGADVDYTFAQVQVGSSRVDYESNCGNMSAAVGPFALDRGMVRAEGDAALVRIFNTNTRKLIHAAFPVSLGRARLEGDFEIPGVAGVGAAIRLDFLDPGGATTGRLLPTGALRERLVDRASGRIDASLVDAANACIFVRADDLGLSGTERPDAVASDAALLDRLEAIRRQGSVAMGIAPDLHAAGATAAVPYVAVVSRPRDFTTLEGRMTAATDYDLGLRVISNGQPHRAVPLTVGICAAVAARLPGTLPAEQLAAPPSANGSLRLGMPSGVLDVRAEVRADGAAGWRVASASVLRTARRLFDGEVWSQG